jgi:hypothetical protein
MAFFRGPNVVTNGLVLALDAANPKSYVSGSTTWNDLSGNNYNLIASTPYYSGSNGGSLYFPDNTNSTFGASTFDFTPNGGVTMEAWIYPTSASFANNIGHALGIIGMRSGSIIYSIGVYPQGTNASGWIELPASTALNTGIVYSIPNIWYHTVWTITTTTALMYINGILAYNTSGAYTLTPVTGGATFSAGRGFMVGKWIGGSQFPLYGNVAASKIYNRALSSSEVLQNYNALKSRFNLN